MLVPVVLQDVLIDLDRVLELPVVRELTEIPTLLPLLLRPPVVRWATEIRMQSGADPGDPDDLPVAEEVMEDEITDRCVLHGPVDGPAGAVTFRREDGGAELQVSTLLFVGAALRVGLLDPDGRLRPVGGDELPDGPESIPQSVHPGVVQRKEPSRIRVSMPRPVLDLRTRDLTTDWRLQEDDVLVRGPGDITSSRALLVVGPDGLGEVEVGLRLEDPGCILVLAVAEIEQQPVTLTDGLRG